MPDAAPEGLKEAVSKSLYERIKELDFPQLLAVILLGLIAGMLSYGVPWAVKEVKDYGSAQETAHREERTATEAAHMVERKERDARFSAALKTIVESSTIEKKEDRELFKETLDRLQRLPIRDKAGVGGNVGKDHDDRGGADGVTLIPRGGCG